MGMTDDSKEDPYCRLGENPARTIACFYCGNGVPWFQCQCFRAREALEGKRAKPRYIPASQSPNGRPIVVLDEEALANGWLKLPRYERASVTGVTKSVRVTEPSVTKVAIVTGSVTGTVPAVTEVVTKIPLSDAERARLYRQRQAEKKARGE